MPKETSITIASVLIIEKSLRKIPILAIEVRVPFENPIKKPIRFAVSFVYTGAAEGKHLGNKTISFTTPTTTNSQNETFTLKRDIHYISRAFDVEVTAETPEGESLTHRIDGNSILRLLPNRE